jgi:hypothetical protein
MKSLIDYWFWHQWCFHVLLIPTSASLSTVRTGAKVMTFTTSTSPTPPIKWLTSHPQSLFCTLIWRRDRASLYSVSNLDNQGFHHDSPKFSNSPDNSPGQALDRIKIWYHLDLVHGEPPGLVWQWPTVQPFRKKIVQSQFFWELSPDKIHRWQKGTVAVPHRNTELLHCRTQSVVGRIVPHPSHLTRPLCSWQIQVNHK